MTRMSDIQELVRRFNEDEAVWQRFQENRLRRFTGDDSPAPDSILEDLDWLGAEQEIRTTRAIARTLESNQTF